MQAQLATVRRAFMPGLVGGLVAGVLLDFYLVVSVVFVAHAASVAELFQFIASGLIGNAAYGNSSAIPLGIAAHLALSILWGIGYAYIALGTAQLRERPLVSGIGYGVVVYVATLLLEVAAAIFRPSHTLPLVNDLVAHTLFYGVPLAYIVRARLRP